jgi:hypothetical protein
MGKKRDGGIRNFPVIQTLLLLVLSVEDEGAVVYLVSYTSSSSITVINYEIYLSCIG